ncbi:MAG TPA: hypothetical protein VNW68_02870, partial [Candidatus Limnocylindria bacterium]|nr:hypothetical protein [Candidatus Limnocylindria bacterium]
MTRPQPPSRVEETRPPLLGDWFIYLSVVVLYLAARLDALVGDGTRDLLVGQPEHLGGKQGGVLGL